MIRLRFRYLIYFILSIVLISSTYALNITSPLNNSVINSTTFVNWTENLRFNSSIYTYNIYLNSTLITSINFSSTASFSGSRDSSSWSGGVYYLAGNNTINAKSATTNTTASCSNSRGTVSPWGCRVIMYYSDGTSTSHDGNDGGSSNSLTFTLTNINIQENISYVESYVMYGTGTSSFISSSVGGNIYAEYLSSMNHSFNPYDYVSTVGLKSLNVSAFNYTGSLIDSLVYNVSMPFNAILNITALNYTGVALSSFSINITDLNTNVSRIFSTTSGFIPINILKSNSYNVSINATGFVTNVLTSSFSNTYNAYQFTLYPSSSLFISIYDESTFNLITQNITVTITDIDNPAILTGSTINGNISFINLRATDTWEVRFTSINYSTNRYYRLILAEGTDYLNAYLILSNVSQNFSMCWYDLLGSSISQLHIFQYVLSNGAYVLTQDMYTDIQGKQFFTFNPTRYYLYNYSASPKGSTTLYAVSPFILNPPQNSVTQADGCNYDITVKDASTVLVYNPLNVSGSVVYNNVSNSLNFSYVSTGNYSIYAYTVSKIINGQAIVLCSGNSTLQSKTFGCSVSGYHGQVYVQATINSSIIFFGQYVQLVELPKLFDNLTPRDAAYYSGFIILIITMAGLSVSIGNAGAGMIATLIAGVLGLLAVSWLGIMTPITATLIIVDCVVTIIIGLAIGRR